MGGFREFSVRYPATSKRKQLCAANRAMATEPWFRLYSFNVLNLVTRNVTIACEQALLNKRPLNRDLWKPSQSCQTAEYQGHPATVFCKISVRRNKYCQKFSISWGRPKTSGWTLHSRTNFKAYLINSLYEFLKLICHISLPKLGYLLYKKGNFKFSD